MSAIVTLTMNPALDKSTSTHHVVSEDKLRCAPLSVEPGGGGVNVSRAIDTLEGESLLLYTAGGLAGQAYSTLLQRIGLHQRSLPIAGETRESITVFEESTARQYRFTMPGPTLSEDEWQGILQTIANLSPRPDYLVASGSLPPGAPEDFYVQLAEALADWPTRLIVDTSGRALGELSTRRTPIYLIKPNLRELQELAGHPLENDDEIVAAARSVLGESGIEVLVVSLGAAGVLLVTGEQAAQLRSPTVPIRSKIGAGDSTVAGITLGLARGMDLLEAVRYGIAAGAAAVMTPGTELCRREDVERLYAQLQRDAGSA